MEISKAAIIEFFLFASPKPLTLLQIKEMVGDIDEAEIKTAIDWLRENYYHQGRALQICEVAEGFQMCTREEFYPWLKRLTIYQRRRRLSMAALEVLAIITYKQPITRSEIDDIRGVNSTLIIKNLLRQKLIRIVGKKECPGHPILYGTGNEFLTYFGLKSLTDLPKESELSELIANENTSNEN